MTISPGSFKSYFALALILILLGLLGAWTVHNLMLRLSLESLWWIETPGALTFAAFFFSLFDKWIWAWPPLRTIRLVQWPDLRGRWSGEIKSSFNAAATPIPAVLEIRQTATQLSVSLYTEHSRSTSLAATILREDDGMDSLQYGYLNRPQVLSDDSMHIHAGSAYLRYYPDIRQLTGHYFTSQDRSTHGSLLFDHQSKTLIGRYG